jgi:alpha-L-rhamnosidase
MTVSRRGLMMGAGLAGVAASAPALAAQALQSPAWRSST